MSQGYDAADLSDKIRSGEVDASIEGVLTDKPALGNLMLAAERASLDSDTSPLRQLVSRGVKPICSARPARTGT